VIVKITYVTELQMEGDKLMFQFVSKCISKSNSNKVGSAQNMESISMQVRN